MALLGPKLEKNLGATNVYALKGQGESKALKKLRLLFAYLQTIQSQTVSKCDLFRLKWLFRCCRLGSILPWPVPWEWPRLCPSLSQHLSQAQLWASTAGNSLWTQLKPVNSLNSAPICRFTLSERVNTHPLEIMAPLPVSHWPQISDSAATVKTGQHSFHT